MSRGSPPPESHSSRRPVGWNGPPPLWQLRCPERFPISGSSERRAIQEGGQTHYHPAQVPPARLYRPGRRQPPISRHIRSTPDFFAIIILIFAKQQTARIRHRENRAHRPPPSRMNGYPRHLLQLGQPCQINPLLHLCLSLVVPSISCLKDITTSEIVG